MKTFTTFLIILVSLGNLVAGGEKPALSQTPAFRENKGQVSDQFGKQRPDILFSGTDGNLVYHLKHDGLSYQLTEVKKWCKREGTRGFGNKHGASVSIPS